MHLSYRNWIWIWTNKYSKWNKIYRSIQVSHELRSLLRESFPYVKIYRYNPKHLCPKLNGYRDNYQRKVWSSSGCTHCTCQLSLIQVRPCVGCHFTEFLLTVARSQELLECSWRAEGLASDSKQQSFRAVMNVQWAVTVNMSFSYEEYADMHFLYGFCNGKTTAAVEEYRLRYPRRRIPDRRVFTRVHQRLREKVNFQV